MPELQRFGIMHSKSISKIAAKVGDESLAAVLSWEDDDETSAAADGHS